MAKILINPGKYIQGRGELANIATYAGDLGNKFFILVSPGGKKRFSGIVKNSFEKKDKAYVWMEYDGKCSMEAIEKLEKDFAESGCDVMVGLGGGKILDTAKSIAHFRRVPAVIAPTVAASDAPCSALAILYNDKNEIDQFLVLRSNPSIVLVDSEIIAAAPVRLFVTGMGDALATYYEARASYDSGGKTCAGGYATQSAMAIARLCYDILMAEGRKAKRAVERGVCTEAVEKVIEANIYMSGVGFESGGVCAAHPINEGFAVLEPCKNLYHGEIVAFGALVQLILQDLPQGEIMRFLDFCIDVELPVTLEQIGITEEIDTALNRVSEIASKENQTTHVLPIDISPQRVFSAIIAADAEGKARLSQSGRSAGILAN
jgi:glycerol dehydrogenase